MPDPHLLLLRPWRCGASVHHRPWSSTQEDLRPHVRALSSKDARNSGDSTDKQPAEGKRTCDASHSHGKSFYFGDYWNPPQGESSLMSTSPCTMKTAYELRDNMQAGHSHKLRSVKLSLANGKTGVGRYRGNRSRSRS